ncbi:MAG: sialidase family protein [bacterium]|nr:sialidase family protein [bacterium]
MAHVSKKTIWQSGSEGYPAYRIPALVRTPEGALLAFCEGRKDGLGDAGRIDLLLKRSDDGGQSWSPAQVVVSEEATTCGNPCSVVDRDTGIIWMPFCKNRADGGESLICQGKAPRTVWLTHSGDDGRSWSAPVEITSQVKDPSWTWYATGPGHGIQLQSGRLLIPCDHMVGVHFDRKRDSYHSHVIYSDDHGQSWHIGGQVQDGTNECQAAELSDGRVYINCRNYVGDKRRASAVSRDGGNTFGAFRWEETLIEPICQASLIGLGENRLVFANPASISRENLTIRVSRDGGQTWSVGATLHAGPAAYSDLVIQMDGKIGCLYECGEEGPYERLVYAELDLNWIDGNWK